MIDLYAATTPNTLKVLFMLGETRLPFELHRVQIYRGAQFTPEFRTMHPHAKVPVIVDRDGPGGAPHTVFESGAILIYLADKTGLLLGSTPAERSTIMQWLIFQMSTVGPMFGQAAHFNGTAREGNDYARRRFVSEAIRLCETLDARLRASRYLGGEAFSIADVATFPWLWTHPRMLGIDTSAYTGLRRWIAEIEIRPGLLAHYQQYRDLVKIDQADHRDTSADERDRFWGRGPYWRV